MFPAANGECSTSCWQKVRFALFSCYFLRIIRQSIQGLCPVFSCKVFFRGVEGSNKVWTSKTSLCVSRQDFVKHGGRVISAAKQPEILHVPLVATNDLWSESPNSIFGTSFFLKETMNSFPGTNKLAFTGSDKWDSYKESDKWDSYIRVSKMKNTKNYQVPESGMRLSLYLIKNKPDTSYTRVISWWENNASCLCYC